MAANNKHYKDSQETQNKWLNQHERANNEHPSFLLLIKHQALHEISGNSDSYLQGDGKERDFMNIYI